MFMTRIAAVLCFLITSLYAIGQQRPQYTQYMINNYLLNPAITGIESYTDFRTGYREQWTGLNEAPVTSYFSLHMPLGISPRLDEPNSMYRSYVEDYRAPEPHHGIGIHGVIDKPGGPISSTDINLTYAYHLGLSSKMTLSMGFAAGLSRITLDQSKINLTNSFDPAINAGNRLVPDLGVGLWLYGPSYFAGVSGLGLLGRPITFSNSSSLIKGEQGRHVFATAGYKVFIAEEIAVIPSFMIKYINPAPLTYDINTRIAFKDKFWVGGSWRKDDAMSVMAGFNISSLINFSYSHDFTTSSIKNVSTGTHEIVLGILLNNRFKVTCPQENW
jgi:type IX secretion system PorP/SprF family membrane protein